MSELIAAGQLPRYLPGKALFSSDTLGWKGVKGRSYRYTGLDVFVPPMSECIMIAAYRHGLTPMQRQFDGHWSREECMPGEGPAHPGAGQPISSVGLGGSPADDSASCSRRCQRQYSAAPGIRRGSILSHRHPGCSGRRGASSVSAWPVPAGRPWNS